MQSRIIREETDKSASETSSDDSGATDRSAEAEKSLDDIIEAYTE
ncbi:hypothetical protein [Haloarcula saliterrae]|nr:hypothetical protein [Haloarcula sp. S1CR25-12]